MKRHIIFSLIGGFIASMHLFAVPASAQTVEANQLELRGVKPGISAPGPKPVTIKDKAKINKRLDLRGALLNVRGDVKVKDNLRPTVDNAYNLGSSSHYWATLFVNDITLPEGGTVDGVDISALATSVEELSDSLATTDEQTESVANQLNTLEEEVSNLALLPDCASGEIITSDGAGWVCDVHASSSSYQNLLVVAKSGAEYTTIGEAVAAVNAAGDASNDNQYVIYVAPGTYEEIVVLPDYTSLVGASRNAVRITSSDTETAVGVVNAGFASTISDLTILPTSTGRTTGIYANEVPLRIEDTSVIVDDIAAVESVGVALMGGWSDAIMNNLHVNISGAISSAIGIHTENQMELYNSHIEVDSNNDSVSYAIISENTTNNLTSIIRDTEFVVSRSATCGGLVSVNANNELVYEYDMSGVQMYVYNCDSSVGIMIPYSGTFNIHHSEIVADPATAILSFSDDPSDTVYVRVASSLIEHGVTIGSATHISCYNAYSSYTGFFEALSDTCGLIE